MRCLTFSRMAIPIDRQHAPQLSPGEPRIASGTGRLPWILAWLTILPLAVLRAGLLAETDTFWQVRTGLLTIEQRAIPRMDTFSWTAHGEAWTLNSWGYNVVVGAAYRVAGL